LRHGLFKIHKITSSCATLGLAIVTICGRLGSDVIVHDIKTVVELPPKLRARALGVRASITENSRKNIIGAYQIAQV
jgi:hypothetical protein